MVAELFSLFMLRLLFKYIFLVVCTLLVILFVFFGGSFFLFFFPFLLFFFSFFVFSFLGWVGGGWEAGAFTPSVGTRAYEEFLCLLL